MTAVRPKLDIDTTRDRLVALGCSHAAEQLEHLLSEAVRQEIPAHSFIDRLLQAELSGREERRVKISLKTSNLPIGQTLENFDFAFQSGNRALAHRHAGYLRLGAQCRDRPDPRATRGRQNAFAGGARDPRGRAGLLSAVLPLRRADDGAAGGCRLAADATAAPQVHVDGAAADR